MSYEIHFRIWEKNSNTNKQNVEWIISYNDASGDTKVTKHYEVPIKGFDEYGRIDPSSISNIPDRIAAKLDEYIDVQQTWNITPHQNPDYEDIRINMEVEHNGDTYRMSLIDEEYIRSSKGQKRVRSDEVPDSVRKTVYNHLPQNSTQWF